MNAADKIATISAAIAFLSLLVTIYFSWRAYQHSNKAKDSELRANDIAIGQSETSLREAISNARERVEEATYKIEELLLGRDPDVLSQAEQSRLTILSKARNASIENYLNAYEDACGKYIDNKIDKDRFRKSYISEVANLCRHDVISYARFMHPKATSKFEAIWKVFDEWHRHEK